MPLTPTARRPHPLMLAAALAATASLALTAAASAQSTTPGTTAPSAERSLVFPAPGVVAEALVREGDAVKAGQPLMKLDDREEAKRLEALKITADGERLKVTAAEKELDLKRVELDRKKTLLAQRAANEQEVQEAQLAVDLAEIQVELAKQQAVAADAQTAVQQIRVEQMTLACPGDIASGVVVERKLGPGEFASPNAQSPALKIVQNDPMYVQTYIDTPVAARLGVGDTMKVQFPGDPSPRDASVLFISPVANAASSTRLVKLQLPNPQGRETGLNVRVVVPGDATADATMPRRN